jgi:hypothetical protein
MVASAGVPKLQWPAVAACVAFASLGVTLIINRYIYTGSAVIGIATIVLTAYVGHERRARSSALKMATWLIRCAEYGTKNIQNANDVKSAADVPKLRERHDTWVGILRDAADTYLHASDADELKMLHYIDTPRTLPSVTPEDAKIRHWAAERVDRLRKLARRLQGGETTLKRRFNRGIGSVE